MVRIDWRVEVEMKMGWAVVDIDEILEVGAGNVDLEMKREEFW